jgi:hypothetical protein
MCWRAANLLIEKLDGIFDASREANLTQFLSKEQRVITGVESTSEVKKDDARPTPLLVCQPLTI